MDNYINKTKTELIAEIERLKELNHKSGYKNSEASLIEINDSEEKYKALYENAPLSYQSLDEDGAFKDVNPCWLETLGYERKDVIGNKYADFLHPDWKAHFETNFPAFKKRGYVNNVQFKIRHKEGHFIDISFEGCIGYNPDGSVRQTYCVFQDITERKKAEDDLQESLQREKIQANIVRNSPLAIAFGYPDGRLENCNQAFSDLTGYSEKELKTINWNEVLTPSKWNTIEAKELQKLSFDNNIIRYEKEYIHKTGEVIPIELVVSANFDKDNNIVHFIGFITDITERKLAEEELNKHHEQLEELVKDRTMDVDKKNEELERMNKVFIGRELKMVELKEKIKKLEREL